MITLSDRPYRYPWFRAVQDGDAYLFEYGGSIVRVTGPSAVPLLSALLPRLDGTRTVEEIQRDLTDWGGAEIRQALSVLLSNGIITASGGVPETGEDERLLLALMGPPPAGSPVKASAVGVAGSGSLAQAVRQLCEQAGVARVRSLAWGETPPEPCALVIAAADGRDLPQLDEWNRRMLARGQSWLLVLPTDGLHGAVGPLFIPGETACYTCLQIRRRSVHEDPRLTRAYDDKGADRPMGGAVTAVLAGLAVHVGLRWLAYRDARVAGILFEIRLIPHPVVHGHEVFPIPRCLTCRIAGKPTSSPWYPGVREPASPMRLVSPLVGPIRTMREIPANSDHAVLPAFAAETADLSQIHGCCVRRVFGSALHYDRGAAMAAAAGEAVERYCGAAVPVELPVSSAAEMGPRAVPPARFALFHPDQHTHPGFVYRPFLPSTRVRWTQGVAIETRAPACLPAQLVYLGAEALEQRGEAPIGYATSSGMACAPTAEGAILAGLLELIERDAVMLTWYLQQSPPRLHWRGDPRLSAVEERCFAPTGLRHLCLDLSEPLGVATVLAVVFGTDVGLAVGAGSALTPQDAWLNAMREAFATYAWADRLRRRVAPIAQTELHLVRSFADHVRFYADPRNLPLASFLWGGDRDRDGDDRSIQDLPRIEESAPRQQIAAICERIRAAGASAYAVDLTTADIHRVGLSVWKVVSPELQPLDVGYDRRYLGGARLAARAGHLGSRSGARPAALNPWPHPFP